MLDATPVPMDQRVLDHLALNAAIAQAEKSLADGGIPIGAALMDPAGTIVALGHNQRVQTGDSTAHAETVCIRNAGRRRDWHTLTIATTLSPCAMCSGTTVLHRIKRVVIGENRTFQGREDWLQQEGIEVAVLNNYRCVQLMERFIKSHPELWDEDIGVPPK
jgi:cytosine/creatinine deaminase